MRTSRGAKHRHNLLKILAIFLVLAVRPALADEGMWPFNQFPKDAVREKHKFEVTGDFLDHLRLASVRLAGGSGAFVSSQGLLLTSRQAVADCLAKLSANARTQGLYAAAQSDEPRCAGLTAEVLLKIDDVTTRVKSAAKDNAPAAHAIGARNAAIAQIEKNCEPRHRCSVVKLFSGGRYDLYDYQVYDDLRLVFAPEYDVAFFGKERDSITYLRYGLNVAFLRAYENGRPASTPHFLKMNPEGVKEGDLLFAAANPAPTARSSTAAQLAFERDTALPAAITRLESRIQQLTRFSSQNESNLRAAQPVLAQFLSEYKITAGKLIGLRDDRLVMRKTNFEGKFRRAVQASKLGTDGAKVWDDLGAAYKTWAPNEKAYQILEAAPDPGSALFRIARRAIRKQPPDANEAPLPQPVEILLLTRYLEELKSLGDKQVPLKNVLGGKSPQEAAEAYVKSGNLEPLAQAIEDSTRRIAKKHEEIIGSQEASAAEKIAQYRFKLFGAADYPDATGTPRVEFGTVKGYTDRAGVPMPYASTFSGLYYRENKFDPYLVPKRWLDLKSDLSPTVALNFVSTCDIGGGDFGSPTINRAGELVGVIFDGNLESLPGVFLYSDEQARAVHVSSGGIAESLEKIYKATPLLHELALRAN
jgi:Peptidase S46